MANPPLVLSSCVFHLSHGSRFSTLSFSVGFISRSGRLGSLDGTFYLTGIRTFFPLGVWKAEQMAPFAA